MHESIEYLESLEYLDNPEIPLGALAIASECATEAFEMEYS